MQTPGAISAIVRWVDRFEERGVYVPGEDNRAISPWRDYGWTIAAWLVAVGMLLVFFAMAS
ncbi:hypothetical protein EV193_110241 [Herbihabitans rhizosphaerae]|uniref:DUF5808 domain-containing protein n=1 Tax=Herbihabitans rhizosphaerae TaxID=1872711 RepID=A0A4Q7KGU5_9PSEU|nr:hypothetical protein [Herbihabitans rhizosphaerae]RZS34091.1 hypothetical protein EV193_110241 [Herbihabitans rhizosphaerae]